MKSSIETLDVHLKDIDEHWPISSSDFSNLYDTVRRFRNHLCEVVDANLLDVLLLGGSLSTAGESLASEGLSYVVTEENCHLVVRSLTFRATRGKEGSGQIAMMSQIGNLDTLTF